MNWKIGVGLLAVGFAFMSAGCSSSSNQQQQAPVVDTGAKGYQIFQVNCAGCHGNQLQGVAGPSLSKIGAKLSKEQIESRILNGGGGMPPFKQRLDQQELAELVDWLAKQK
ncbi:c-type cytochrome [Effusibacillus pohliae]|uniref:c-type cytochrome n=1 Tax=Effusibacillus pohliae TaxID=232270 RepID=UPI000371BFB9|nr:cytochrome c [Effusibacillus pohliae]